MKEQTNIQNPGHSNNLACNPLATVRKTTDAKQLEIQNLSDTELESRLKTQVTRETALTIQILHLLAEVEKRRLYSHAHPSLFEYCTRELKYSPGSAQRRIDTMRAMKLVPDIEQKLESGALHLSTVAKAQSFFRQEQKSGKTYTPNERKELLTKLEHKSAREVEKHLVEISPHSAKPDQRREITATLTELRLTLPQTTLQTLNRLRELLSNKHAHLTDSELVSEIARLALEKLTPKIKPPSQPLRPQVAQTTPAIATTPKVVGPTRTQICQTSQTISAASTASKPAHSRASEWRTQDAIGCAQPKQKQMTNHTKMTQLQDETPYADKPLGQVHSPPRRSRHIPAQLRNTIWHRDHGKCTHPGCSSRYRLQVDHIVPFAKGGQTSLQNLRLLCQTHNLLAAQNEFGRDTMNMYRQTHLRPAGTNRYKT